MHHNPTPGSAVSASPDAQAFRTRLELAVELVRWAVSWLRHLGKPVVVSSRGQGTTVTVTLTALALTGGGGNLTKM